MLLLLVLVVGFAKKAYSTQDETTNLIKHEFVSSAAWFDMKWVCKMDAYGAAKWRGLIGKFNKAW